MRILRSVLRLTREAVAFATQPLAKRMRALAISIPSENTGVPTASMDVIGAPTDRKSTRLNSSHSQISYAVFCLKKKKKENTHVSDCRTERTQCTRSGNHPTALLGGFTDSSHVSPSLRPRPTSLAELRSTHSTVW